MRARSEADRRPYLRGRHRHHELLGLEYRRVWRIRLGSSRGRRQDPRRDEAHSRRHPIWKIRQGMDAGKQGQPDLVQSDARQMRRPPDRAGWRQAPRDDAVDQGPRAGGQDQELIDGSVVKTRSRVRALVGSRTARERTTLGRVLINRAGPTSALRGKAVNVATHRNVRLWPKGEIEPSILSCRATQIIQPDGYDRVVSHRGA